MPLVRLLAIALLIGTVLLGVGAMLHPVLAGDAEAQLRLIATTTHWRAIHLTMLGGTGLVVAGLWVRLLDDPSGTSSPMVAALAVIALGLCINALNIAFMTGSGWRMATLFQEGGTEMSALFDATHPIGLMAARFGNSLVALGAIALGFLEWRDPRRPRWIAALAWIAAAGGLAGVLFFHESSPLTLAAVSLLSGWQIATALRSLRA
ncbi:MAG: hypothetical protein ABR543_16110 [Gemmatimonadaceae bacterium]